ncbi:MAG: hypothetical protein ACP5O6_06305 [Candidatus Baltobacteraceae bacterium]
MNAWYRHTLVATVVSSVVGSTLLLGNAMLASRPLLRDTMYFAVPFTVAMLTRLHTLRTDACASSED